MLHVKRSLKNPILWPNREHAWEAEASFNGCALREGKMVHLCYRAESAPQRVGDAELHLSTVGYATSRNGVTFGSRRQLIVPEQDWERYGCEDPRITLLNGTYYIFYTALSRYPFSADGIKVAVAITKDFIKLEKHPVTPFNAKAMALFPERIRGKTAALLTADTDHPPAKIALAVFKRESDMWSKDYWDAWYAKRDEHVVPLLRHLDDQVELGSPPIKTKEGWLVLYSYIRNYRNGRRPIFGIEAALLDLEDPRKLLCRTERPFLTAEEEYELYGRVPNVVFPSGATVHNDTLSIYYGAADATCCLATCKLKDLLDDMRATSARLTRFDGNPIITPDGAHAWEAKATFNPGVVQAGGKIHILYRAMSHENVSTLGYASTTDGVHLEERLSDPVYRPRMPFESKAGAGGAGCEDPRLTLIGDTLYMCYTAYDGLHPPRIALTSIPIKDFLKKEWNWTEPVLISPPEYDDKDAAIFPKKINGKYLILHRIGLSVWIDAVTDLKFEGRRWLAGNILMKPRPGLWDSQKIGISGPPIETPDGWLLLYHGVSKREDHHYDVRAALLDLKNPQHVLARTKYPIFEPDMPYEREGLVNNVVFPCGAAVRDGTLYVYYGGADKVVGVASVKLKDLLKRLHDERS